MRRVTPRSGFIGALPQPSFTPSFLSKSSFPHKGERWREPHRCLLGHFPVLIRSHHQLFRVLGFGTRGLCTPSPGPPGQCLPKAGGPMRVWSAPLCSPAPLGPAAGRQRVAMGVAQGSPCCCPSAHLGRPQRGQPEGQEGGAGAQTSSPASEFSAFSPSQALRSLRAPLTLAPTPEAAPITGVLPPQPWNYAWSLCCPFFSSGFLGRVAESPPCGAVMLHLSSAQRAEGRSGSLGLWLPWGAQVSLPRSLRGRGAAVCPWGAESPRPWDHILSILLLPRLV